MTAPSLGSMPINLPVLLETGEPTLSRFWAKVDRNGPVPEAAPELGPCWLWTGATNGKNGYGIFRGMVERHENGSRKWALAHRYSFAVAGETVPDRMELDHRCRCRTCVNPAHLQVLSHRDNTLAGNTITARQAQRDLCVNGHPFDKLDSRGRRRCSICDKAAEDARYVRRHGRIPKKRGS